MAYILPTLEIPIVHKKSILGLALISALTIGSVAVAVPAGAGDWHSQDGGQMTMLSKLNLSDAQRNSIQQIIISNRDQNQAVRQALQQHRAAFEER